MKIKGSYTSVAIDFKQLLEDISYTNRIMKTSDVNIITRNQYYQLKDSLVLWLISHDITQTAVDGFEYQIVKRGVIIKLVKLTITYGETKCLLHQKLSKKIKKRLKVSFSHPNKTIKKYEPVKYENLDFDVEKFESAISRMKKVRILFLREMLTKNDFEQCLHVNRLSGDSWMETYRAFLPSNGNCKIKIVELINKE